jgi:AcrR family transcriptional regulator
MPLPDDTETRILNSAGQVFAEKGFEGATVRKIIERAGVNLAAVNYYFRDKERLYIETVKHAIRGTLEQPPPAWSPDVPPTVKLREFIHWLVGRMMSPNRPAWHAPLLMRELAQPTAACAEFVRDYVLPVSGVLQGILQEVLPPQTPRWKRFMTGFSIVGQCLYYVQNRPVMLLLVGEEDAGRINADTVARHVTEFTLAALGLKEESRSPASRLR